MIISLYILDRAYGLSGQDQNTKIWPQEGESITFTAHVYNRCTDPIDTFSYSWIFDGEQISTGTMSEIINPGQTITVSWVWTWTFTQHTLEFVTTVDDDV